jgi:hypothetical protein
MDYSPKQPVDVGDGKLSCPVCGAAVEMAPVEPPADATVQGSDGLLETLSPKHPTVKCTVCDYRYQGAFTITLLPEPEPTPTPYLPQVGGIGFKTQDVERREELLLGALSAPPSPLSSVDANLIRSEAGLLVVTEEHLTGPGWHTERLNRLINDAVRAGKLIKFDSLNEHGQYRVARLIALFSAQYHEEEGRKARQVLEDLASGRAPRQTVTAAKAELNLVNPPGVLPNSVLFFTGLPNAADNGAYVLVRPEDKPTADNPLLPRDYVPEPRLGPGEKAYPTAEEVDATAKKIIAAAQQKLTVTNGDGPAGNPTIDLSPGSPNDLLQQVKAMLHTWWNEPSPADAYSQGVRSTNLILSLSTLLMPAFALVSTCVDKAYAKHLQQMDGTVVVIHFPEGDWEARVRKAAREGKRIDCDHLPEVRKVYLDEVNKVQGHRV